MSRKRRPTEPHGSMIRLAKSIELRLRQGQSAHAIMQAVWTACDMHSGEGTSNRVSDAELTLIAMCMDEIEALGKPYGIPE